MPNEQHYNRLQGIRIGVKIRQGDYVYAPLATNTRLGVVKGGVGVSIDEHGAVNVDSSTFASDFTFDYANRTITINLKNGAGEVIATRAIVIPLVSQTTDGIMQAADKLKIDNLFGDIIAVERAKKDDAGRIIEDSYGSALNSVANQDNSGQQRTIQLLSPTQKTLFTTTLEFLYATALNGGLMTSGDKQKLDGLWALFQNQDPDFLTFLNTVLSEFENNSQGVDLVTELANKADKVETRDIGEETIIRSGGRVVEVDNPHCHTQIIYSGGRIAELIETYKADNKTYKTTLTRDINNKIIQTKKEQV